MERTEKNKSNKFNELNFNLKNMIFEYFPYKNIMKNFIPVCKSFKNAYFKKQMMQPIFNNYKEIIKQITLSNTKITEIKTKYFSHFDKQDDKHEEKIEEIICCMLSKKYVNQKMIWLMKNPKKKNVETFLSLGKYSELEKKLILKNRNTSFIDSKDLHVKYFSDLLSKNEVLINIDLSHNHDLFKNKDKKNSHILNNNEHIDEDSYFSEDDYYSEESESSNGIPKPQENLINKDLEENDFISKLNTNLKLICDALEKKKKLKVLKFNSNFSVDQFQGDKDLILTTIKNLDSIEVLELSENEFGSKPKDIENISFILKDNLSLITLDFSCNLLSNSRENFKLLYDGLLNNSTLTELNLSNNEIGNFDTDLFYLKLMLERNKSIKTLNLTGNKIGDCPNDVVFLFTGLEKNRSLKSLVLNSNRLGENRFTMYYIFKSLNDNNTLETLELADNEISDQETDSVEFLDLFENKPNIHLKKLNLSENGINLNLLNNILEKNLSLQELDLSGNLLDQDNLGFKDFCALLARNVNLRKLNLSQNELGNCLNCMKYLKEALIANSTLKKINLRHNAFGDEENLFEFDIGYFSEIIENNKGLEEIEFDQDNDNFINNIEFSKKILTGLLKNKTLTKIDLSKMSIGLSTECVVLLTRIIEKHPNLKTIDLSKNEFAEEEANFDKLCVAIGNAKKIEKLILRENKIGKNDNDILHLCKALESNRSMKEIEFGKNLIFGNSKNKKILLEYLKKNATLKKISFDIKKNSYDSRFVKELKLLNKTKNIVFTTYN